MTCFSLRGLFRDLELAFFWAIQVNTFLPDLTLFVEITLLKLLLNYLLKLLSCFIICLSGSFFTVVITTNLLALFSVLKFSVWYSNLFFKVGNDGKKTLFNAESELSGLLMT